MKKRNESTDLQSVLAQSKKAAENGYKQAAMYLLDVEDSIEEADRIIRDCKNEMVNYHITDVELINNIQDQLMRIRNEFYSEFRNTERDLDVKRQQLDSFNITLFGRTMAGKSTLMEILTHGSGASIGKGGQRTTRDVRSYSWKGMAVTDVPGIDAFEGADDDEIAEKAVNYADLVLFLITAGQPESTEADWLVKLKQKDKPLVCICNYKSSLSGEQRIKRFLDNPDRLESEMNVSELVNQFNQFIQTELPNEKVDFLVTHLLAKFYSQQPQYKEKSQLLSKLSKFDYVEKAIVDNIQKNGIFYRKKSFLSIVDVPIYQQSVALFEFSASSYGQYLIVKDKTNEYDNWCNFFNESAYQQMHSEIDEVFNLLDKRVSGFVEDHSEDSDPGAAWQRVVENFGIEKRIERVCDNVYKKVDIKIQDLFNELQQDMKLSYDFNARFIGDFSITNWKKGFGWAASITGVMGLIAGAVLSGPVGWVLGGIGAVFGLFSWIARSREKKLRENRQILTSKIRNQIEGMRKKGHGAATKWYRANINNGIMQNAHNKLKMVSGSFLSLANAERQLALGYTKNHNEISKNIVSNILVEVGAYDEVKNQIIKVARIPSKSIVVVTNDKPLSYQLRQAIAMKIGNKEEVKSVRLDVGYPLESQVHYLFNYFNIPSKPRCKRIKDNNQVVVYIDDNKYKPEEMDNIILVQQILNVHIIKKNYEY